MNERSSSGYLLMAMTMVTATSASTSKTTMSG